MRRGGSWKRAWACMAVLVLAGCTVRHVPVRPALEPMVEEDTPRAPEGAWVALVMDPRVISLTKSRTYSLTQEERYSSGDHMMRGLTAQLKARGVSVIHVHDERQARELHAPVTLMPDSPGLTIIRPKGLLDFSALGSINRISVNYSVRYLREGQRVPERVEGSSSRTASFFWTNALLQSMAFSALGFGISAVIYGGYFGLVAYQNFQAIQATGRAPQPEEVFQPPPTNVAIAVLIADILLSQVTAQVFPRVINPLLDIFVNEPRWEVMVQGAHDDALQELADNLARKLGAATRAPAAPAAAASTGGAP